MDKEYIDIVFDGPPSYKSGRFVEVENEKGESVRVGQWIDRGDGFWALRLDHPQEIIELKQKVLESQADSQHVRDGIRKAKDKIKEYTATQCGNEVWDILHDTEITTKGVIEEGVHDAGN